MTAACTVRRLARDDAEDWARLRREALEAHPLAFGASVPDDTAQLVESALVRLAAPESAIFGAFVDDALIGIAGVRRDPGSKERHKAIVWGMYVTAVCRRRGAGSRLLQSAIDRARSWPGVTQIHLSASAVATEARGMYEAHGFRAWGVEPRALCWEGHAADEIHMVLVL